MAFDPADEYQNHAYFLTCFVCEDCRREETAPVGLEPLSDEWCEAFARTARNRGWYVPPKSADGGMDVVTCFCGRCAAARGLRGNEPNRLPS